MNKKLRARVDLIDGFLGAGKTTFIQKYMKYLDERGISYMVLENEFGAAGVDASILGGNVRELTGGCICCGQKVNFHNLLIELRIRPSGSSWSRRGFSMRMTFSTLWTAPRCGRLPSAG